MGWRTAYNILGCIGIGSGIAALTFIKEPKRNNFEDVVPPLKVEAGADRGSIRDEYINSSQ